MPYKPSSPPSEADSLQSAKTKAVKVERWEQGVTTRADDQVAQECAIALTYNGISHVVMMATPEYLEDFALGFSLTEEIIQAPNELYDAEVFHHCEGIEVSLTIASQRLAELKERRRNLTGRTGCGLCGAESLTDAIRAVKSVERHANGITDAAIQSALNALKSNQILQGITGAVHGAAWCDAEGQILMLREDVGRHNALDKLIGALRRSETDISKGFVLVTSRASYEMVQKASSQGMHTLVAVSAPTSLAIELAQSAGLTLYGFARSGRHIKYN